MLPPFEAVGDDADVNTSSNGASDSGIDSASDGAGDAVVDTAAGGVFDAVAVINVHCVGAIDDNACFKMGGEFSMEYRDERSESMNLLDLSIYYCIVREGLIL